MVSLKQLIDALAYLGINAKHIELAITELRVMLDELDEVEVKGRQQVDTLLGCMMAIETIIGKDGGEVNG